MADRLLIHADRIFDGEDLRDDRVAVVEGARVVDVVPAGQVDPAAPVRRFPGGTLIPGLIDAHAHLGVTTMGTDHASVLDKAAAIFRNVSDALQQGYTTVRDLGGVDGALARLVDDGDVPGPTVLPSSHLLCQTGGHGDQREPFSWHGDARDTHAGLPGLHQFSRTCDGAVGFRAGAREAFRRGATQLKLCLSGGIVSHSDRLEDVQLSGDEIEAVVAEAQARGTYVTAHAFTAAAVRHGLRHGVTCFEHGTFLDEETVELLAAHDIPVVPTLSVVPRLRTNQVAWGIPDTALARLDEVDEANRRAVSMLAAYGVRIGSGSDAIGPDQSGRSLEIVAKAAELGGLVALRSATSVNASILGLAERGSVRAGSRADLVVVPGDPVRTPAVLLDVASRGVVIQAGHTVHVGANASADWSTALDREHLHSDA